MPWFKVDDKFWSHPKVILLSNQAVGLWARAGAWCAGHLTDGLIHKDILRRISPDGPRQTMILAAELVDSGLWIITGDAYQFHDWTTYQPTRDRVESERAAARERQDNYRRKRRLASVTPLQTRESRRDKRRESHDPDPTRPDPTTTKAPEGSALVVECEHGEPRGAAACALCRHQRKQQGEQR